MKCLNQTCLNHMTTWPQHVPTRAFSHIEIIHVNNSQTISYTLAKAKVSEFEVCFLDKFKKHMGTSRNTHSRFKLHIFLGESWPERVDSSICQIGFNWVTQPIIVQGFSWSSGTTGKFKYNPTTTNGIVIWCMIQVQPCTAISNTLGWKLPPEADFDFNWLWHSDPANHTIMKQCSAKVDSALLMVARDYGNMSWSPIHAQLKQNSSKKCAGVGSLLAVHIGLGSLGLWLCIATNDLPAALTVTDDCDATAVWN